MGKEYDWKIADIDDFLNGNEFIKLWSVSLTLI